jgi:magnesium transporter
VIVDCAAYRDGHRRPGRLDLEQAFEAAREPGTVVWIGLFNPTPAEFDAVRIEFELHPLAAEDAMRPHQRPKAESYPDTVFVVLKTARWVEADQHIEFAELHVFVGHGFVVSIRHGEASALGDVRRDLEANPELLACGTGAILHAICDRVVDDYGPVLEGLEGAIDDVEAEVFSGARTNPAERIFGLKRQTLEFHRNTAPLLVALDALARQTIPVVAGSDELARYFRDVEDHLHRIVTRVDECRELLSAALEANLAQISVRQNEDMRTISAWAAVIAVPTMLAGLWGMNFTHMPELDWKFGYPLALVVIVGSAALVYTRLRRAGWL